MTLDHEDIAAIAAEVVRLLGPALAGKLPDPTSRLTRSQEVPVDPTSFAARRQAALEIAAKKGILKRH